MNVYRMRAQKGSYLEPFIIMFLLPPLSLTENLQIQALKKRYTWLKLLDFLLQWSKIKKKISQTSQLHPKRDLPKPYRMRNYCHTSVSSVLTLNTATLLHWRKKDKPRSFYIMLFTFLAGWKLLKTHEPL